MTEKPKKANAEPKQRVKQRSKKLAAINNDLARSQQDVQNALLRENKSKELQSDFISITSHGFRTPLTAILSSASLIASYDKTEDADKRKKHVDRIISSVNTLRQMLNSFLSPGKSEEGLISDKTKE